MKTKLTLSIIALTLIPFYAETADKKKPELKGESFNWKFAFTEKQINALEKSGYSWDEELIPNGDMQSTVDGFHDIYGWAKPMKIEKNKETGERELVLMQRDDGGAGGHLRVYFKPKPELKAGDIILAQYRFLTNLSHVYFQPYGGAWVPMEGISAGLLSLDRESPKYKTAFILFFVTDKNNRWPNRLHIGAAVKTEAPRGLRITHWSARKLITKDSDGDGKSDAEEILMTKTSPSQPNKFVKKLTKEESGKVIEKGIRNELNKPTGELTNANLQAVKGLAFHGEQITDVSLLTRLTHLKHLNLTKNQITDVTALRKLKSLEGLLLGRNQIKDLSPLADLTKLRTLHIDLNQFADITPLAGLTNLQNLNLDYCLIKDFQPLLKLTNLTSLHLGNNPNLTMAQVAELQKALPKCNIRHNATK